LLELALQLAIAQVLLYELELCNKGFKRWLDVFEVGKANITPNGVRTFRQARHIPEAGGCELDRQSRFTALFRNQASQGGGNELRKVAEEGQSAVMASGIHEIGARANSRKQGDEGFDAGILEMRLREGRQDLARVGEERGVGILHARALFPGQGMPAQEQWVSAESFPRALAD